MFDWSKIFTLIEESRLVDGEIYECFSRYYFDNKGKVDSFSKLELPAPANKNYSINAFPVVQTPEVLWDYYDSKDKYKEDYEHSRKCIHDIILYKINAGLNKKEFFLALEKSFKITPFVKTVLNFIKQKGNCRFGEVNQWIHENCSDVPLPYRWELKENTHILYDWLAYFYKEISWDVPGKKSQVIYWAKT